MNVQVPPGDVERAAAAVEQAAAAALDRVLEHLAGPDDEAVTAGLFSWVRRLAGRLFRRRQPLDDLPQAWEQALNTDVMPRLEAAYGMAVAVVAEQQAEVAIPPRPTEPPPVPPRAPSTAAGDYLAESRARLERIAGDLADELRAALDEGQRAGESIDAIADRVQAVVEVSRRRAVTIARTETIAATNAGALAQMQTAGLTGTKRWLATSDDRTRPTHRAADGQTVPMPGLFRVGADELAYPGDPRGAPGEVINCRCTLTFTVDEQPAPATWAPDDGAQPSSGDWLDIVIHYDDPPGVTAAMTGDETMQSGMPRQLKDYWLRGEGAVKIGWGTPGAFDRCVAALRDDVGPYAEGTCANLYKEATGRWPGEGHDSADTAGFAEEPAAPPAPDGAWEGILTIEGGPTGDGRQFGAGALSAAPLPLPLMWQQATARGHDGAVVVGRIDQVWRDGPEVWGRGVFDLDSPDGQEAYRRVADGYLRGVSVDVDSITEADVEYVYGEIDDGDGPMPYLDLEIYNRGRIRGATLVALPAYVEAQVRLGWSQTPTGDLLEGQPMTTDQVALVACGCQHDAPPAEWFADPKLAGPTPLTVTEDGRVYGHGALWGTCHTGFGGQCVTPPREGEHAFYRLGETLCADGSTVATGKITLGTGHAPTAGVSAQAAAAHYDNTGSVVADVASGEDQYGIWVAGALRPGVPPEQVRALRAAQLSGDWRRFGGSLRLVAMLAVNVPGFPVPRLATASTEGRQVALVAAGVVPATRADRDADAYAAIIASAARDVGQDPASRLDAIRHEIKEH